MDGSFREAKYPVSALAGPYGHPFHPMLVTVPIGAWFASLVFDLASHVTHDPGFLAKGSQWLIAIGLIGALLAASVGFLDLFAIPAGQARRAALIHMSVNLAVTCAYLANCLARRAGYGHPGPVSVALIALSVASFAALMFSGYLGGRLAYRYGIRVADENTQAEGYAARRHPG